MEYNKLIYGSLVGSLEQAPLRLYEFGENKVSGMDILENLSAESPLGETFYERYARSLVAQGTRFNTLELFNAAKEVVHEFNLVKRE